MGSLRAAVRAANSGSMALDSADGLPSPQNSPERPESMAGNLQPPPESDDEGFMVALIPSDDDAAYVSNYAALDPGELHTTLVFYGDAAQYEDTWSNELIAELLRPICRTFDPIEATLGGITRFSAPGETDPIVLSVDSKEVHDIRLRVLDRLQEEADIEEQTEHGFTAHMTLGYLPHKEPLNITRWNPRKITFDRLRVALGDTAVDIFLGTGHEAKALVRHVATAAGVRRYNQPLGTVIGADAQPILPLDVEGPDPKLNTPHDMSRAKGKPDIADLRREYLAMEHMWDQVIEDPYGEEGTDWKEAPEMRMYDRYQISVDGVEEDGLASAVAQGPWTGFVACKEIRRASYDMLGFKSTNQRHTRGDAHINGQSPTWGQGGPVHDADLHAFALLKGIQQADRKDMTMYRGVHISDPDEFIKQLREGDSFDMPLASFGNDRNATRRFGKDITFVLQRGARAVQGSQMELSMEDQARREEMGLGYEETDAYEYVTGGRFRVTGVRRNDDGWTVLIKQTGVFDPERGILTKAFIRNQFMMPKFSWMFDFPLGLPKKRPQEKSVRRVRSQAGVERFGLPIGSIIGGEKRMEGVPGFIDPDDPNPEADFDTRNSWCYRYAAEYVVSNPEASLLHGEVQISPRVPAINHAWAQLPNGDVFEPNTGHRMTGQEFNDFFNPTVEAEYDGERVREELVDNRTWGPWHEDEGLFGRASSLMRRFAFLPFSREGKAVKVRCSKCGKDYFIDSMEERDEHKKKCRQVKVRHVRTPNGSLHFGQPIGSVIRDDSRISFARRLSRVVAAGDLRKRDHIFMDGTGETLHEVLDVKPVGERVRVTTQSKKDGSPDEKHWNRNKKVRRAVLGIAAFATLAGVVGGFQAATHDDDTHQPPAAQQIEKPTTIEGVGDAPKNAAGFTRMWSQIDEDEWGAADVSLSVPLPDGRSVWLYGDTLSNNNGFVHSTAIVQSGDNLHVSNGGKQLLPDDDANNIYWIEAAEVVDDDQIVVTAAPTRIGTDGPWDFERSREDSRQALVTVDPLGDVAFQEWVGYTEAPEPFTDFTVIGPNHFTYEERAHPEFEMESGGVLYTVNQNWDDDMENHKNPDGSIRFDDWKPIFFEKGGEQKALPKQQKCKYCKGQATKRIIHSEGMAYIPVCNSHLDKGKTDAANCVPFGKPDPSNIDAVREIKDVYTGAPGLPARPPRGRREIIERGKRYHGLRGRARRVMNSTDRVSIKERALALDLKVRRVATPEGVEWYKQPLGTVIVRDAPMTNLTWLGEPYDGWTALAGPDGTEYYVGKDEENNWWVATEGDGWDNIVVDQGSSENAVVKQLNEIAGKKKPASKRTAAKKTAAKRGTAKTRATTAAKKTTGNKRNGLTLKQTLAQNGGDQPAEDKEGKEIVVGLDPTHPKTKKTLKIKAGTRTARDNPDDYRFTPGGKPSRTRALEDAAFLSSGGTQVALDKARADGRSPIRPAHDNEHLWFPKDPNSPVAYSAVPALPKIDPKTGRQARDKNGKPLFDGYMTNAKGELKRIPVYKQEYLAANKEANHAKALVVAEHMWELDAALKKDAQNDDNAAAVALMRVLGIRVNSQSEEAQAKTKTGKSLTKRATLIAQGKDPDEPIYGASSLQARHVKIRGGKAYIEFNGKESVLNSHVTDDPTIVKALQKRVRGKKPNDRLFPGVSDKSTQKYIRQHLPGATNKDLRTYVATTIAVREMEKRKPPKTPDEFEWAQAEIAATVALTLNNKGSESLGSYIAGPVWDKWKSNAGVVE